MSLNYSGNGMKELLEEISYVPIMVDSNSIAFKNSIGDYFTILFDSDFSYTLTYEKEPKGGWNKEKGNVNFFDVADKVNSFMRGVNNDN